MKPSDIGFLTSNAGKFVDGHGSPSEPPRQDESVVIVAGPWEDMPRGAMQSTCAICRRLVGLDVTSQGMVDRAIIICRTCYLAGEAIKAGEFEKAADLLLADKHTQETFGHPHPTPKATDAS